MRQVQNEHTFSMTEIRDILISAIVLTLALMIAFATDSNSSYEAYFDRHFGSSMYVAEFVVTFIIILLSFVGHELGHKFVAQDLGCWAEFRMYPLGLLICIALSFTGFIFAAPGAVYIEGVGDKNRYGKISIAGPAVNLVLAAVGIIGCLVFNYTAFVVPFVALASMNVSLALFNLIPVMPLDGAKVWKWNKGVYLAAVAVAIALLISFYTLPDLYYT
ncbi:MAG: site-2 protease family protein [Methanomethylophilus sp.]|jgi:Zn-dependent protease